LERLRGYDPIPIVAGAGRAGPPSRLRLRVRTYVNPERRPVHAWSERGRLQGHCISFTYCLRPWPVRARVQGEDLDGSIPYRAMSRTVGLLWVDLYLARANP
jgi:hypothetical protein